MIDKALERAILEGIQGIEFRVADAYALPFADGTFDMVVTEFVAQFLDAKRAFTEFARVVAPSGFFGLIELYREDSVPPLVDERLAKVESIYQRLTGFPFHIHSISTWKDALASGGFVLDGTDLRGMPRFREAKDLIPTRQLLGMLGKLIVLSMKSKAIRERFKTIQESKRYFIRDKLARQYSGYGLFVSRKR